MFKHVVIAGFSALLLTGLSSANAAVSVFEIAATGEGNGDFPSAPDADLTIQLSIDFDNPMVRSAQRIAFSITDLSIDIEGTVFNIDTAFPDQNEVFFDEEPTGTRFTGRADLLGQPFSGENPDSFFFESQVVTAPGGPVGTLSKDDFVEIFMNGIDGTNTSRSAFMIIEFIFRGQGFPGYLVTAQSITDVTPGNEVPVPAAAFLFPLGLGALAAKRRLSKDVSHA